MRLWPFGKQKQKTLPGMTPQPDGRVRLELTPEEQAAIDHQLAVMRAAMNSQKPPGQEGEWYIHPELLDGFAGAGLWRYAEGLILSLLTVQNSEDRQAQIDKATAALMKAYSFCPVPILMFDVAWLTKLSGKPHNAADSFQIFLAAQQKYQAKNSHDPLLSIRNIDHAIAYARREVERRT